MNTQAPMSDNNELTVLVDFTETEKALASAEERFKNVVHDVKTTKGMKAAKADVSELRTMRTTTDKARLEAGRVLLAKKKAIDDQAKGIIERIAALEDPLKAQIEAHEAEVETERLRKLEAERQRVESIHAKINAFRELPSKVHGWPSARIELEVRRLLDVQVTEAEYEEFTAQAGDALEGCKGRLYAMLEDAKSREAEAERVRQQEAELAAMRERNAQLEREAAEAREREERRQREEAEAAERRERERLARIRAHIEGLAMFQRGNDTHIVALHDRLANLKSQSPENDLFDYQELYTEAMQTYERSLMALVQAIDARETLDREAAEEAARRDAEHSRLEAEAKAQLERAEQAERQRREEAAKAEEARQASITLRSAADALLSRVHREGHGSWQEAIDLGAVLANSEGDVVPTKSRRKSA